MRRSYTAFLVRCWHVPSQGWRIIVRAITAGAEARHRSWAEACAWMAEQAAPEPEPDDDQPAAGPPDRSS